MAKFLSTAYGPPWVGIQGTGVTATGVDLRDGPVAYIVAVDPRVIPLHSKLAISPNPFGSAVVFRAEDTGGVILGNHIDFYDWRGRKSQLAWGTRYVEVTRLGTSDVPVQPVHSPVGSPTLPAMPDPDNPGRPAGESRDDYSILVRSAGKNIQAAGGYTRKVGDIILGLRR